IESALLNAAQLEAPNTSFMLLVDNLIPYGTYSCIWSCVCLQHIVDEELLKCMAEQMEDRLHNGGYLFLTENVSDHASNHYLAFRSVEEYAKLFSGLELIIQAETGAMGQEAHVIMVFQKQVTLGDL
ncbi:unnamed protein product, partial [marine sediment metagenome]